ncbi:DNA polymerase III subunit epsilon [Thermosipho affectus]|uniref:DNA polymerase III subunit epsilon n=1 Tax=Thermosipho affectus TaxID=660294 RepID=A0ABX3ILL4_9BACT|nr:MULTISPECIES: 3'-5' exonuclease [Thermosipho]ANQ53500.1 DNA polymerase III subunit epsilon [Thermosipho sp. 1070]APT71950.1 DNA polymerase III subunit epsilon [Thermosipho sp. 1063]ONN27523.1 DNA polymerase III subunit epsilon [Thermosipho affectus]OOC44887.1 DNA polymerase III subunit epsilon [Thermosipho sp. 1074]
MVEENVYCVLDTETTGLNPWFGDRIIEVAIVPVYKGKIVNSWIYHSLVNPSIPIPALSEKIHGISNAQIADAPGLERVLDNIRAYTKDTILVMHNATMDLSFLDIATKEVGQFPINAKYIDTLEISESLYGKRRSLESLVKEFKLGSKVPHRALQDAILTAKVFLKLSEKIGIENLREFVRIWGDGQ